MDNNTARELLHLAMAYREKAMAAAPVGGDTQAAPVRAEAETWLAQVRAALITELETRATALRAAIEHPAPALDVTQLRQDISAFNEILRAKKAEQLGEYADLPIEAYPPRIRMLGERLGIWPPATGSRKSRRFTIAGIEVLPTRRGFAIWSFCLAVAWAVSAYYLGILRPFQDLRMDVSPPERGIVQVTCRNVHLHAVTLFVPGTPGMLSPESSREFTLVLYLREKPGSPYRLLPAMPNAWSIQGKELHETAPVELGPLMACELALSLANIRDAAGVSFSHLRLVLVRAGGATADASEIACSFTPGI